MAHFIVTFRLENNSTYQKRYDSFVDKAKELAVYLVWDETTSFLAFETNGTAEQVRDALYYGSQFNATTDMMVVIDVDNRRKATKGSIAYPYTLDRALGF